MAVTTQIEDFDVVWPELRPLLQPHWEELALFKKWMKLNVNVGAYRGMQKNGNLLIVTVRKNGRLIGYIVGVIDTNKHYEPWLVCKGDVWRIIDEERGRLYERRLFRAFEKELRRRGVKLWWMGEKVHHPCGRLYEAMGMALEEKFYVKEIG